MSIDCCTGIPNIMDKELVSIPPIPDIELKYDLAAGEHFFPLVSANITSALQWVLGARGGIPSLAFPSLPLQANSIAAHGALQQTLPGAADKTVAYLSYGAGQQSLGTCHSFGHLAAITSTQFPIMLDSSQHTLFFLSLFRRQRPCLQ